MEALCKEEISAGEDGEVVPFQTGLLIVKVPLDSF